MMRWLLTLSLILCASIAHATLVTWNFTQVGNLGHSLVLLGSDGLTTLSLAAFGPGGVNEVIVGKQDNPIDHGLGVGTAHFGEIDIFEKLVMTLSANVPIGPVTTVLESVDGPLGSGESWSIRGTANNQIASGFGGNAISVTFALPADRSFYFTSNEGPDDYLVRSISVNVPTPPSQVDAPGSGVFIGFGVTLMTGVLLLRGRGRRPAAR